MLTDVVMTAFGGREKTSRTAGVARDALWQPHKTLNTTNKEPHAGVI